MRDEEKNRLTRNILILKKVGSHKQSAETGNA